MAVNDQFPVVELGNRAHACMLAENTDHAVIRRLEVEAWAFRAYTRALVAAMPAPPSDLSRPN